ncbi:tyrosine-type recombinase/integrase [Shouchella miscanthi]|uniref:tyrosine-type recombinase/integrase n=1 Tax=Shouchella miscanthi TaxID=2598861 RepID=UPI0011A69810|nr:site-specific integrase [Shouchella miscanthi]
MVRKLGNKRYSADISLGKDPLTGERRRRQRIFSSKKEAEMYEEEQREMYRLNRVVGERKLKFPVIVKLYLEHCKLHGKPSYYANQRYLINKHIIGYFENSDFIAITTRDIKNYQQKLIDTGLVNKSINNVMITLKNIFNKAIEEMVIPSNPCDGVKNLKINNKQMSFWTPDQFKEFISLIDEDDFLFKVFYTFAYLTGMRCGEMLALNWNDIDRYKREINVHKSLNYLNGEVVITEPKTKNSIRRVSVNKKLIDLLDLWREKQIDMFYNLNIRHHDEIHIFQYREKPPTKDIFSRRIRTICNKGELKPIRLHDLRHSHVALLIDQREDHVTIKERLGHASIKTTIDVYGHLFPNKQQETADKFDTLF